MGSLNFKEVSETIKTALHDLSFSLLILSTKKSCYTQDVLITFLTCLQNITLRFNQELRVWEVALGETELDCGQWIK